MEAKPAGCAWAQRQCLGGSGSMGSGPGERRHVVHAARPVPLCTCWSHSAGPRAASSCCRRRADAGAHGVRSVVPPATFPPAWLPAVLPLHVPGVGNTVQGCEHWGSVAGALGVVGVQPWGGRRRLWSLFQTS